MSVGPWSHQQLLEEVQKFHGYAAPGVVLGAYMVELARRDLPEGTLFEAIAETPQCLPDAVQLLTPCTIGNGWLHIMDFGLYAVSLYDKHTGKGFRAYVDLEKLQRFPHMYCWLLKLKPKQEQDSEKMREEMATSCMDMLSVRPIQVKPELIKHRHKGPVGVCPSCGESYPLNHGDTCRSCQGQSPYVD